jgi:CspA family cold shock protein
MGRGRDREPRRRDFDDDYRPPARSQSRPARPTAPASVGEPQDAVVKWFNPEKGFGFVELSDGSGDAFLHVNAIQAAGADTVSPGTALVVQIGQGAKGAQVSAVLEIGEIAESPPPRGNQRRFNDAPPRSPGRQRVDTSSAVSVSGEVKWFNPTKGFGFIQADDGLKDIFVHASVVSQAGLATLEERQRLRVQTVTTPKGREAVSIELLDE